MVGRGYVRMGSMRKSYRPMTDERGQHGA